jgi:Tol biopolymer transport system component
LGALAFAVAVVCGVPLIGGGPSSAAQDDVAPFSGALLYLRDGDVWRLDLNTQEQMPFIHPPSGTITHVAHSPDRQRLAYSVVYRSQAFQVVGADLVVADADGANARAVVQESGSGFSVGWPTWPSEASKLLYAKRNIRDGSQRVEEVDLNTGERTLVLEEGSSPAASPTAPLIAYQTWAAARYNILFLDRPAGTQTQVVDPRWFEDADDPSFSPDGATLAFVGAGSGPPPAAHMRQTAGYLLANQLVSVAQAHDLPGVFFDLWAVGADGSGLTRIAQLFDNNPFIAWSPSGRHVAAWGLFDVQIVDVTTGGVRSLGRTIGSGPISWGD